MNYGYYPGCSLEGISVEYDHSMRSLFRALDVAIEDVEDWICCGTMAAPAISHLLGLAAPLWNVAKAGEQDFDALIAPCSACLYHFKSAAKKVRENPRQRAQVEAILDLPLKNPPRVIHPLELLAEERFGTRIREAVQRDMSQLKAVCYYGCHISRPADVMEFDDPEHPESMDKLLDRVGIRSLEWAGKVDCCGAHFSMIKPEIAVEMCAKLFESALEAGAETIVVACPMCHANLDTRQDQIAEILGRPLDIPVLYFSQVVGYAIGLEPKPLGLKKHIVDPLPLMLEACSRRRESSVVLLQEAGHDSPGR